MSAAQPDGPGADFATVGETLVMFTPPHAMPLDAAESLSIHIGGAESNVATYLAELGYHAVWYSRVGDDPFGRIILRELARAGVDVEAVTTVVGGRTGIYVKDPGPDRTTVYYFRNHSVAKELGAEVLDLPALRASRILHLSGITPALSDSARDLVTQAVRSQRPSERVVSFDVNYRQALWPIDEAAPALREIAELCDICFVGLDEAELLWGCSTPEQVRALLPDVPTLVVKDGAVGAHSFGASGHVFVPSLSVDVVEPVGAGDAFAAGYLAGVLDDRPEKTRLRLGHLLAVAVLQVTSDHAQLPPRQDVFRRCEVPDEQWVSAGWEASSV